MKKKLGFSLLELMLSLTLSALIVAMLSRSYASLYSGVVFNRQQLDLNQNLRFSIGLLKHDLQNAGVFGSFSFHDQAAVSSYTYSMAAAPDCKVGNDWCRFESETVGVKSYRANSNLPANVIPPGTHLDSLSDILRLQYGGNQVAYIDPQRLASGCSGNNSCLVNQCSQNKRFYLGHLVFNPSGIESHARIYFLASANHGYLLSFNSRPLSAPDGRLVLDMRLAQTSGCLIPGQAYVQVESAVSAWPDYNYISNDPDMSSLMLVNFYTRYYFVATINNTKGLYVETLQADGNLSAPELVSARVTRLTLAYKVDSSVGVSLLNRFPAKTSRYSWCTTAAMNEVGPEMGSKRSCNAKWASVSVANITLDGSSEPAVTSSQQEFNLRTSASVGWLW